MVLSMFADNADRAGQAWAEISAAGTARHTRRTTLASLGHIQLAVLTERETARIIEPARHCGHLRERRRTRRSHTETNQYTHANRQRAHQRNCATPSTHIRPLQIGPTPTNGCLGSARTQPFQRERAACPATAPRHQPRTVAPYRALA